MGFWGIAPGHNRVCNARQGMEGGNGKVDGICRDPPVVFDLSMGSGIHGQRHPAE